MTKVNKREASKLDVAGELYVDPFEDGYAVFGSESGFCYATFNDKSEAQEYVLERMANK